MSGLNPYHHWHNTTTDFVNTLTIRILAQYWRGRILLLSLVATISVAHRLA